MTEAEVRAALLKEGRTFNAHILATVTNRINTTGGSLREVHAAVIRDLEEIHELTDESDPYGAEPEWSNPGPHDGYRARKHVDVDYHGESFHQGE